jgi:2-methylcitrate dehydratase
MEKQMDNCDDAPDQTVPAALALGRRDLFKLGAGVVATALSGATAGAQRGGGAAAPPPGSVRKPGVPRPHTGPGYKYTAKRLGNNGPMDDTTRKIVKWVHEFDESKLTEPVVHAINRQMLDSMGACISSFETEPARISAKVAGYAQPIGMKATVLGYGVSTTPELAAFANGVLVRETDLNDATAHYSNVIPGVLAMAEAMHASGTQTMIATAVGFEMYELGAGESIGPAMAAGKLMGLDEDRLANALTIALTAHVALNKGVGIMSMWKGVRSAEATKCGIWSAILAREGMTGPPQPFEGRGGLWATNGRREFDLPVKAEALVVERQWFKRRPGVASSQEELRLVPEIRAWTNPDDIEWIEVDTPEIGESTDAPKWDPPNRETADHSRPYMLARAILDGDIWLDSYTDEKLRDPAVHALMDKMTFGQVQGWSGNGSWHMTIRKKNGEERSWDTLGGKRAQTDADNPFMSDEEIAEKFNRICAYHKVNPAQRDRARAIWSNIRPLKDIGEAIQTLAKFGQPKPL